VVRLVVGAGFDPVVHQPGHIGVRILTEHLVSEELCLCSWRGQPLGLDCHALAGKPSPERLSMATQNLNMQPEAVPLSLPGAEMARGPQVVEAQAPSSSLPPLAQAARDADPDAPMKTQHRAADLAKKVPKN
jgi:hypothetical protein